MHHVGNQLQQLIAAYQTNDFATLKIKARI